MTAPQYITKELFKLNIKSFLHEINGLRLFVIIILKRKL